MTDTLLEILEELPADTTARVMIRPDVNHGELTLEVKNSITRITVANGFTRELIEGIDHPGRFLIHQALKAIKESEGGRT